MEGSSYKILIADDNLSDRMILTAIVKKMGHVVLSASDGLEAISQFTEEKPDIILLDVMMPNMNGQEAAIEIKRIAGEDMVPIIFLTSLQDASDLAKCLESGGDDFLSKPYNPIILTAKINAFSRMLSMHNILQQQKNVISKNAEHLLNEQQVAKAVYDNVAHSGCLDLPNLKYLLSPFSVFNGDVLLAARRPTGSVHILLGDFTGHGLPAAIGAMPLAEIFYGMTAKGFLMEDILREINSKLKTILPIGYFCCACMANLSFRKKTIEVWMGGLPDYYVLKKDQNEIEHIASTHLPLGVLSSQAFDATTQNIAFDVGDKFYMWSDGIIESRNDDGDLFGEGRLKDIFYSNSNRDYLFDEIVEKVNDFTGESGKDDDTTMLEVSMVEESELEQVDIDLSGGAIHGPTDWKMEYTLRADTLKSFNPLPVMLNILNDVPSLRRLSGQLYTLMSELFSNAFEHGVLGLSSDLKSTTEGFAKYYQLRSERMNVIGNHSVCFIFDHIPLESGGRLTIKVIDTGKGFDYEAIQNANFETNAYCGRGIPLIKSMSESLKYSGNGNTVEVVLNWQADEAE
ncbi:MAG: DNA-binding response OmpR family regulator [Bermanella sp.]|jgi:DNA-binding response OmpR family regulator/anti-sigma regulatory factor (Ser/Thr protein kinase)